MNIILTGVTGIIGREVLTELLMQQQEQIENIICLARKSKTRSAADRVNQVLQTISEDCGIPLQKIMDCVKIVDTSSDIDANFQSLQVFLQEKNINSVKVLHLASTTNLSPLFLTEEEIYRDSYLPTIHLLQALIGKIEQFSFVSTAFSCGHQSGLIPNSYLSGLEIKNNRNYYERYKLMAEKQVKLICEQHQIKWQVLRSSIVSGRLLRAPYYYTPKFNVFYAWTGFFASLKSNGINCDGIRILCNPNTGVNIVSSDYVALATVRAFFQPNITELNLTHSANFENTCFIPAMLNSIGVKNFEWVSTMPENMSTAEKMYYKTVGLQFSPYINTFEHQYDSTAIRNLMQDIPEPDIKSNFSHIIHYAIEKQFRNEVV